MQNLGDRISRIVISEYEILGKRGKPIGKEWTVLAGIVMEINGDFYLISMATGVKCLSQKRLMNNSDDLIHDSHAEVLCRRGAIKYLAQKLIEKDESIFNFNTCEYRAKLNGNIKFHMYISRSPCGDASMRALADEKSEEIYRSNNSMIGKVIRGRASFDKLGSIRTKPGRIDSEPSHSMSCSDKISMWNFLGFQGSLLDSIIGPLYLSSIVVGEHFDQHSLDRALYGRISDIKAIHSYFPHQPSIFGTTLTFMGDRANLSSDYHPIPCETSILKVRCNSPEYYVRGTKQGASPNKLNSSRVRPIVCRNSFANIFKPIVPLNQFMNEVNHYQEMKALNSRYESAKVHFLKSRNFNGWLRGANLNDLEEI